MDIFVSSMGGESCGTSGSRSFANYYSTLVASGSLVNDVYPGGQVTRQRTGMVLAMWYDPDDTLHTLTADVEYTYNRLVDAEITGAASTVEYKGECSDPAGGAASWTGSVDLGHSVRYDVVERSRVTVRDNGVTVPALSHVVERQAVVTQTLSLTWSPPAAQSRISAASCSSTLTVDGVTVDAYTAPAELWSKKDEAIFGNSSLGASLAGDTLLQRPALIFPVWQSNVFSGEGEIDLVRWSNHVLGARIATPAPGSPSDRVREFGPVLTPGGVIAHSLTLPASPDSTRYLVSGSWRPVRNQFAASVTVDDGGVTPHSPVCWV